MNGRTLIGASVLTVALAFGTAGTANAVTVGEVQECKDLIDDATNPDPETSLREATEETTFGGRFNRDGDNAIQASLLSKLDDATAKLMTAQSLIGPPAGAKPGKSPKSPDGKIEDALYKLIQYQLKVSGLIDSGNKAKVSPEDKACLLNGSDDAAARWSCETVEGVGRQDDPETELVDEGSGVIGCVEDLL